ncbi:glycosyltransferase family 39 protein [Geomonas oryzisoli]|uniref:Glycosyltransferase family 39 protein n=1 Tax=Geomonas oryzisoli TaxID=2847992 RepID=A0ABX8J9N1_9BACT|nr:tetratricopeptide repeat protein [Geomonas oryzisoli]QWV95060.1 glycosyltransferase family 39 protein [Geomonas oryzisoli]
MTSFPESLTVRDSRAVLLLIGVVVALFLPAVWCPSNPIDDPGILSVYGNDLLTLAEVVSPGGGYYYRPLIALSFYLDYHVLAQDIRLLHLENVLIHATNAVLLFLFGRRLFPKAASVVPLAAALIFALHPVNTEAVNWIAGRTDPLAALFVLLAGLALCRGLATGRGRWTVASVALTLFGALAKETALFMIPASFLIVQAWISQHPQRSDSARRQRIVLAAASLALSLLFAFLFSYRALSHGNSVATLMQGHRPDLFGSVLVLLKSAGFYVKKMLFPWPLNIAIDSVSAWYLVPALAALLLLWRSPKTSPWLAMTCTGFMFLMPPLAVALFGVAWTPVAERYLYIPSLFFSLGGAGWFFSSAASLGKQRLAAPVLVSVLVILAFGTWQRISVWRDNIALYRDAVAQSPDFAMLHNTLAVLYAKGGRIDEAHRELNLASSLEPSELLKVLIRKNRISLAIYGVPPEEARRTLNLYLGKPAQEDTELLDALRKIDVVLIRKAPAGAERDEMSRELVEVNEELYARTRDPLLLYHTGQLLLGLGEEKRAGAYFGRSFGAASEGAYYKAAAGKLAAKYGEGR